MSKEMLINVSAGEECRIALVEDGRLQELYMERTSATSHVGNIYKGKVTNVEASIQAAFVDFGLGRNGFLHISDLMPTYFPRGGDDYQETVGNKLSRRDRPPIQRCLRRGDDIVVQIIKEGIGTKGPTLSTYLSIPGKMLVMMPGMGKMGVSKKIEDDAERRRLRDILNRLRPPKDVAFIIRTAGVGKAEDEIERDLRYLTRLWERIDDLQQEPGPIELYTEGDLVARTVRDVYTADVDRIVVDDPDVARRVRDVISITSPEGAEAVEAYDDAIPLFTRFGVEREIEQMYSRHVPLPSGGSLVIDSTEAIVAIDVNSGKFRDHSDAETTAFKTDMEAAEEIPRQLKLRDLGGVVICDFIDLRYERHRRELEETLFENFKRDRAKTKVLRMSEFGIIELTRQRMRPSLKRSIYFDCPHCKGAGLVKTPESISLDVMRRLAVALNDLKVVRAELSVAPDVAFYLLNKKRAALADLEDETGKRVVIKSDATVGLDELKFELFDAREGTVVLEEIGMTVAERGHTTQLGRRPAGHTAQNRGNRGGGRGPESGRTDRRPPPAAARGGADADYDGEEEDDLGDEDRLAIERGADSVDDREAELGFTAPAARTPTVGREQDRTDLPAILETQAGDEVADEFDDDEDEEGFEPAAGDDRDLPAARAPQPSTRGGQQPGRRDDRGRDQGRDQSRDQPNREGGRGNRDAGYDRNQPAGRGNPPARAPEPARGQGRGQGSNQGQVPQGFGQVQGRGQGPAQGRGQPQPQGDRPYAAARGDQPGSFNPDVQPAGEAGEGGGRRRRRRRRRRGGRGEGSDANGPLAAGASSFGGEMAGNVADEFGDGTDDADDNIGNRREDYDDDDGRDDRSGVGTFNDVEPSDEIAAAAEGGDGVDADAVNTAFGDGPAAGGPAGNAEGEEGGGRRRRRRGGRRHRRNRDGEVAEVGGEVDAPANHDPNRGSTGPVTELFPDNADAGGVITLQADLDAVNLPTTAHPETPMPVAVVDESEAAAPVDEAPAPSGRRRSSKKVAPAPEPELPAAEAVDEDVDDVEAAEPAAKPKRGKAAKVAKTAKVAKVAKTAATKTVAKVAKKGAKGVRTPPKTADVADPADVVRTGSSDAHLAAADPMDEAIEPSRPARPKSYADLDAIPDDFD